MRFHIAVNKKTTELNNCCMPKANASRIFRLPTVLPGVSSRLMGVFMAGNKHTLQGVAGGEIACMRRVFGVVL